MRTKILLTLSCALLAGCTRDAPKPAAEPEPTQVKFETTAGDFVIEVRPEWAPLGAERFLTLVREGYFEGNRFFRVVPGFVVQWGMHGDPAVNAKWASRTIRDEPVRQSNTRGRVVFAKTGLPNSRSNQFFINLGDNSGNLDPQGFAPFGEVVEGMDAVQRINAEYGQKPLQDRIASEGNVYLSRQFPRLDQIEKAYVLE